MIVRHLAFAVVVYAAFQSSIVAQVDRPELVFESEVTWKDVFDAGFRPRHVLGLETTKAESINDGFDFRYAGDLTVFRVGGGRTLFSVLQGGEVRFIGHDELERMTVQEALERLREFARMGGGNIFKNPLEELDLEAPEADLVRQLHKANVIVRKGESTIQFGFRRTSFEDKPLLGGFFLSSRNRRNIAGRTLSHPIQPPVAYEEHDMSPYYDYEAKLAETRAGLEKQAIKGGGEKEVNDRAKLSPPMASPSRSGGSKSFWWFAGLVTLFLLIAAGALGFRHLRDSS